MRSAHSVHPAHGVHSATECTPHRLAHHRIASNPAATQPTTIPDTNARGSARVVVPWGPGTSGKPTGCWAAQGCRGVDAAPGGRWGAPCRYRCRVPYLMLYTNEIFARLNNRAKQILGKRRQGILGPPNLQLCSPKLLKGRNNLIPPALT